MLAISHVLPAENTEFEHLSGRQFGRKIGMEIPADGFNAKIDVTRLHAIVHLDTPFPHISFVAILQKKDCNLVINARLRNSVTNC